MCYYEPAFEVKANNAESFTISHNLVETQTLTEPTSTDAVSVLCKCVTYLREVKGYNVRGDADTIEPNTDTPIAGGVVILDYNGLRHVAGIKYVMIDRILVEESNYDKCAEGERVIMLNSDEIVGFFFRNPNI